MYVTIIFFYPLFYFFSYITVFLKNYFLGLFEFYGFENVIEPSFFLHKISEQDNTNPNFFHRKSLNFCLSDLGLVGILILYQIFFFLFKNMLSHSANYYFTKFFISKKSTYAYSLKSLLIDAILAKTMWLRPTFTISKIADNTLACFSLSLVLLGYNNYNNIFFFKKKILSLDYLGQINFYQNMNLLYWIPFDLGVINIGLIIDSLSLLMLVVVLSISSLVHYYSIDYMYADPWIITFMKYLSGFTSAMLILITGNNLALVFLGWEGVGIFSYLLIGFWYTRTLALKASLKAVIVNKIGDIALLIAMSLCLYYFGSTEFCKLQTMIFYLIENKIEFITVNLYFFDISLFTLISFFLLIAAVGKSAQLGLHTWLPDAMEGPTPVSALIHAATMVTAGVYLIVWTSFFFENSEICRNITIIVGGLTALFGSAVACVQYDIKKIIAFSTCSQIGYMFLACGLSCYNVAMFHLFTHAFFKALLFLCAGSIIHSVSDQQDIRKMGGLVKFLPLTYSGIVIGLCALMGLPFTSGFYSKDSIIEMAYAHNTFIGFYGFICSLLGAVLTAFYCYWFLYYVFFSKTKQLKINLHNMNESGFYMLTVIYVLIFCTIFSGFFFKNLLANPMFSFFYHNSIFIDYNSHCLPQSEYFVFFFNTVKIIIFIIPFVGLIFSILFYSNNKFLFIFNKIELSALAKNYKFKFSHDFLFTVWHCLQTKGTIDYVYNWYISFPILDFSYKICYNELDWGWLEYFFVKIPTRMIFYVAKIINLNFQTITLTIQPSMLFFLTFFLTFFILIY